MTEEFNTKKKMETEEYLSLYQKVADAGYQEEIDWSCDIKVCDNADDFLNEFIYIVCNSGMKAQIARQIFGRIIWAMKNGMTIWSVFKNFNKVCAMNYVWGLKNHIFSEYCKAEDKTEFCESLPYIGEIIKYHLVKNLGIDTIKPDRHLIRIAKSFGTDPFSMCQKLSEETGYKLATVDSVIWRAANLGFI